MKTGAKPQRSVESAIVKVPKAPDAEAAAPTAIATRVMDDTAGLPTNQRKALIALVGGQSFVDVARIAGVTDQTLRNWRKKDMRFAAILNNWQNAAIDSAKHRLLALADEAVTAVSDAVIAGNASIGLAVLRQMGILVPVTPVPAEPKQIAQENTLQEGEEYYRQVRREQYLKQDEMLAKMSG
jgi:transposase-like protein